MPFDGQTYDHNDSVLRNLTGARAVIANEANWTAHIRWQVGPKGVEQFCALGALDRASGLSVADGRHWGGLPEVRLLAAAADITSTLGDEYTVAIYNNSRGHGATVRMFDGAITARRLELEAAHAV